MASRKINDKTSVETVDHVALAKRTAAEAEKKAAAEARAAHVAALNIELAYLERQPKPNEERVGQVKKQIAAFSRQPSGRQIETA